MIRKTSLGIVLLCIFLVGAAAGQPLEVQEISVVSTDKKLELDAKILEHKKRSHEIYLHELFSEFDGGPTIYDMVDSLNRPKRSPARMTFRLTFEFDGREPGDLTHINEALSAMKLSDLELESVDGGYLETRPIYKKGTQLHKQDGHLRRESVQRITGYKYRYGCRKLSLICTYDETEEMHYYRLTAMAFAKEKFKDTKEFHDLWCEAHPDRIMRMLTYYSSEDSDAFIVLHHEKGR